MLPLSYQTVGGLFLTEITGKRRPAGRGRLIGEQCFLRRSFLRRPLTSDLAGLARPVDAFSDSAGTLRVVLSFHGAEARV